MATTKEVTAENPVGKDGPGGQEIDAKNYATYRVESSKHLFTGPTAKYKDIADELGLKNVDKDAKAKGEGKKLAQGSGYLYLAVAIKGGGRLTVVCDPAKVGTALTKLGGQKIYGKEIERAYIPKKRILR